MSKLKYYFSKYHFALLIILVAMVFAIFWIPMSQAQPDPDLKNKFTFQDSTNITVSENYDGGILFQSTGNHLKKQKVEITDTDFKAKDKIKKGFIYGWHKDGISGLRAPVQIAVKIEGNKISFDIELSTLCVGCVQGTYFQLWNTNQTKSTNNTISQTLNGSVMTSSNIAIQDAKTCSTLINLRGCINRTGLVLEMYMDETTGTLVQDYSGMGNNGTWFGNTTLNSTTGKINTGLIFDGVNDYVKPNPLNIINESLSHSVIMDIKPLTTETDNLRFYNKGNEHFYQTSTDGYISHIFYNGSINKITTSSSRVLYNNNSSRIGFSFNATDNSVTLYANGVPVGKIIHNSPPEFISTSGVLFSSGGSSLFFNGTGDEVLIYNRTLSDNDFKQDYLISVQQMQAKYTTNSTWSGYLNGTSSISLPYLSGELYNLIQWFVPDNITDLSGNTCYNCSQQMQFKPTLTVTGQQDGTNISITRTAGIQWENNSFTPSQFYNTSWYNYTIADYGDAFLGIPILTSNNASAVLQSYNATRRSINLSNITSGDIIYLNISRSYNNAPIVSATDGTFGIDANVTPSCSYLDNEGNPLNISAKLNGITQYGSCGDFGLLPFGSYTYRIWANETSNTVSPLQNSTATSIITVQCNNCSVSGYVNNTLGLGLLNARIDLAGMHNFTNSTGYYIISPVASGQKTILVRAIGYENNSQVINIIGDTTLNFTLSEKVWATEEQVTEGYGYSILGGIIGAAVAIGGYRRYRKKNQKD